MSIITCAGSETKIEIEPFVPAGTAAALATICPWKAFNVDTIGRGVPVGQAVRYCSGASGTTVIFNEYALAFAGMPHGPSGIGTSRVAGLGAPRLGCPNSPVNPPPAYSGRVSISRQGVTATSGSWPVIAAARPSLLVPASGAQ
ncbi:MAG: hypothetical protein ACKV22_05155 [Bryobacteraceae bacterium]